MEIRVARLEEDVREIKGILRGSDARLSAIEVGIAGLRERVENLPTAAHLNAIEIGIAELRGRVHNLPTAWLMLTAIVGGQITLAGLLYTALRFASH